MIYEMLQYFTSEELGNMGDCNSVDGLNPGEIAVRGEGTFWFLKTSSKGLMFFVLSVGGLNPILEANLSW